MVVKLGDSAILSTIIPILEGRGIVIFPGDTIYGLTGIAPDTAGRLETIKGRDSARKMIRLLTAEMLRDISDRKIPDAVFALWPGPLTCVITAKNNETVAVRIPDSFLLDSMLRRIGRPLFSTSVNRSGDEPMTSIADIVEAYEHSVDCIVDGGDLQGGLPSTILDLTVRPFRILRQGTFQVPRDLLEL